MGYRWSVTLRDSRSEDWVGEHRPELIDLLPVFSRLVEMEPGDNLPTELWRASLPPEVHLVRLLGPYQLLDAIINLPVSIRERLGSVHFHTKRHPAPLVRYEYETHDGVSA